MSRKHHGESYRNRHDTVPVAINSHQLDSNENSSSNLYFQSFISRAIVNQVFVNSSRSERMNVRLKLQEIMTIRKQNTRLLEQHLPPSIAQPDSPLLSRRKKQQPNTLRTVQFEAASPSAVVPKASLDKTDGADRKQSRETRLNSEVGEEDVDKDVKFHAQATLIIMKRKSKQDSGQLEHSNSSDRRGSLPAQRSETKDCKLGKNTEDGDAAQVKTQTSSELRADPDETSTQSRSKEQTTNTQTIGEAKLVPAESQKQSAESEVSFSTASSSTDLASTLSNPKYSLDSADSSLYDSDLTTESTSTNHSVFYFDSSPLTIGESALDATETENEVDRCATFDIEIAPSSNLPATGKLKLFALLVLLPIGKLKDSSNSTVKDKSAAALQFDMEKVESNWTTLYQSKDLATALETSKDMYAELSVVAEDEVTSRKLCTLTGIVAQLLEPVGSELPDEKSDDSSPFIMISMKKANCCVKKVVRIQPMQRFEKQSGELYYISE